uniref:hypothetical protein n=1 Tax=Pararhodobacter sp. SW119 TaxID=2780075 RepID=UPI001AE07BCF
FEPGAALFIIWRRPRHGGMHSLAAGSLKAMTVAWEALRDDYPGDELTLQQGTRVLMRSAPMLD